MSRLSEAINELVEAADVAEEALDCVRGVVESWE